MLAACAESPGDTADNMTDGQAASLSATDSATATSIGNGTGAGGQPLTGAVSGLSGAISGFDVRETETQTIINLAADILFEFDSASLSNEAPARLAKAADLIRQGGSGVVAVVGHTDAKGEDRYNQSLSLQRAQAVSTALVKTHGIAPDRLRSEGRGEADPVAPNSDASGADDPTGRARNRRVTIAIPR